MKPFFQLLRPFLFPRGSYREKYARLLGLYLSQFRSQLGSHYQTWIRQNEPDENELQHQRVHSAGILSPHRISLILPINQLATPFLHTEIQSILEQTYPHWDLWIIASPDNIRQLNNALPQSTGDDRFHFIALENDHSFTSATNNAITQSKAEFIGFLEQNDRLAPFALAEIMQTLADHPLTDLLYTDEDHLSPNGNKRFNPIFKPGFSLDYLRAYNYIQHLLVIRKKLGDDIGWLRPDFESPGQLDLIFRAVEKARLITHLPLVLYHRQIVPPTMRALGENPRTQIQAIQEHLDRCQQPGIVTQGRFPGVYHVKYSLTNTPLVSIIIPNHEHADDLARCINTLINQTTYTNFEILIIENNSTGPEIHRLYQQLQEIDSRIKVMEYNNQPFNYSEINNHAASLALGEILLFLNNDTQIIQPDWLERLLEYAQRRDVGAVGAKLLFPTQLVQHAGVIIGMGVGSSHHLTGAPRNDPGVDYNLAVPQDLSAITAACLMIRHEVFDEVGKFDPAYQLGYGDTDLCLKLRQRNYLVVWTPYAELIHHESMTRGYENTQQKTERFFNEAGLFIQRWQDFIDTGDPYYNPNRTLTRRDYSINMGVCNPAPRTSLGIQHHNHFPLPIDTNNQ